ncbi:MAG: hypothetical protein LBU34_06885 [Planctomycetaceae bacterium]|nr:hypothetical protein [Planctomycetaceae bacterium]
MTGIFYRMTVARIRIPELFWKSRESSDPAVVPHFTAGYAHHTTLAEL